MPNKLTTFSCKIFLLVVVYILIANTTVAQVTMVKDIYPGGTGANVEELANANNLLFFRAIDGIHGLELWCSNGTSTGTFLVKDIKPGPNSSTPQFLTDAGNILYFSASDGINGTELWKSDGTNAGTVMVKDIWPGSIGSAPILHTVLNGVLYFTADDGTNGYELWKSDGTQNGTVMIKDINPGSNNGGVSWLVNHNNTLFFSANDGVNGSELWKSDGTSSGTIMIKDVYAGNWGSIPYDLTSIGGILFFVANDNADDRELWKTDGTFAGTVKVKDIRTGELGSYPTELVNVDGNLFFIANDSIHGSELWKSDGSDSGTVIVKDLTLGTQQTFIDKLVTMNGMLYFTANTSLYGDELWRSDGTNAGTVLVKDIYPGAIGSDPGYVYDITAIGSYLYFTAFDSHGREFWRSDGTLAGTVLLEDIFPGGNNYSSPHYFKEINGSLVFVATDNYGEELRKYTPSACNLSITKAASQGNCNDFGSIDLTVTNAVSPISYQWEWNNGNDSTNAEDILYATPGTYHVTVADANNCTATDTITLSGTSPMFTSALTSNSTCSGATGSIDVTVFGGGSPYTYNWSNLASTEDISGLAPGQYYLTVQDGYGCPPVTSSFIINGQSTFTYQGNICSGDSYDFNGQILFAAGLYTDTLQTLSNCDSIVVLTLTLLNHSATQISDTIFSGMEYSFHGQLLEQSGTYIDTLVNADNCDSVVTLHLSVMPLDSTVTFNGTQLFISQPGAQYQWIDCSTGQPIPEATYPSFTPTANGFYQCVVTVGSSSYTTACYQVDVTSIAKNNNLELYSYPNPASKTLILRGDLLLHETPKIEVYDALGRLLYIPVAVSGNMLHLDIEAIETGSYLVLALTKARGIHRIKLIKN